MTDRDTFAAAALTGLLATGQGPYHPLAYFAKAAYEAADAMLAERAKLSKSDSSNTDHDAVPAARVPAHPHVRREGAIRVDAEPDGCGAVVGAGNTQKPVAWAIERGDGGSLLGFCHTKREALRFAHAMIEHTPSEHFTLLPVPLYRQPPQERVVLLPALEWQHAAYMGDGERAYRRKVKEALDAAGVKWEVEE